jgi:hypothetical protein
MSGEFINELRTMVEWAAPLLLSLSESESASRPAPGKWSPKEIVGHLIDSASNNHQRFVRAQLQDDLIFDGYDQDAWVATQRYQDAAWPELVWLWRIFNLHIAHVMRTVPADVRTRARSRHNLHQLAFRTFRADEPATLDDLMEDYVEHLKHHLHQIPGLRFDRSEAGATGG